MSRPPQYLTWPLTAGECLGILALCVVHGVGIALVAWGLGFGR